VSADAERDFLESLSASSLYSIGAYFCDRHPELVEDVVAQAQAIEEDGLALWARSQDVPLESAFQTLVTALAIRYFKAVARPA
jgi:hypothetical protein